MAEAVHIGVLASAITGNQAVYSRENALYIVKRKVTTFSERYKNHTEKNT